MTDALWSPPGLLSDGINAVDDPVCGRARPLGRDPVASSSSPATAGSQASSRMSVCSRSVALTWSAVTPAAESYPSGPSGGWTAEKSALNDLFHLINLILSIINGVAK